MTWWESLAVFGAGIAAGGINTVVGSGTLITFPVLLAFGYSPVTANVSNTIGLVPGSISGAIGYRRELAGQKPRLLRLGLASLIGGIIGAILLLTLPDGAFKAIVPGLIVLALVLVVLQPRLAKRIAARRAGATADSADSAAGDGSAEQARTPRHGGAVLWGAVLATGIYGGYFGAAQGVLLLALFGVFIAEDLQRMNAVKNVLAAIVNGVAAILFMIVADVAWWVVLLIAVGSVIGGQIGAKVGRKLPPTALRAIIVVVGSIAVVRLLL
ncbi:sulfite exporter TauE/SafE family protein [Streptomyces sp. SID3343]|uniref:sulfite exporter TauE/SafE family protein n=1 Tax=Streptomyces sp. SID3343 TaxID=2690260 RepID=UPI00136ACCA4|nr:sulfite exporter TauE/SafE family protein [Streptomyces sp. SID3343]MYW00419.1 TSUP family transporter [Streptomyces sp. SID3343]